MSIKNVMVLLKTGQSYSNASEPSSPKDDLTQNYDLLNTSRICSDLKGRMQYLL